MTEPKWVISMGACASTGGVFDTYAVVQGVDQFMPVVMIAPSSDPTYSKTKANIEEVIARKGSVVLITEEGNHDLDDQCEFIIRIPHTEDWHMPVLTVIPLQLMSYYIADIRGCSIDQPRNLAKSVTVE